MRVNIFYSSTYLQENDTLSGDFGNANNITDMFKTKLTLMFYITNKIEIYNLKYYVPLSCHLERTEVTERLSSLVHVTVAYV